MGREGSGPSVSATLVPPSCMGTLYSLKPAKNQEVMSLSRWGALCSPSPQELLPRRPHHHLPSYLSFFFYHTRDPGMSSSAQSSLSAKSTGCKLHVLASAGRHQTPLLLRSAAERMGNRRSEPGGAVKIGTRTRITTTFHYTNRGQRPSRQSVAVGGRDLHIVATVHGLPNSHGTPRRHSATSSRTPQGPKSASITCMVASTTRKLVFGTRRFPLCEPRAAAAPTLRFGMREISPSFFARTRYGGASERAPMQGAPRPPAPPLKFAPTDGPRSFYFNKQGSSGGCDATTTGTSGAGPVEQQRSMMVRTFKVNEEHCCGTQRSSCSTLSRQP